MKREGQMRMESADRPENSLSVLVVDDIDASRNYLAGLVTDIGHLCHLAGSGSEALQCIEGLQIDIVLLDLLMPDVDGFEITRRIHASVVGKWLPVIVLSSLEGDEHFIHALSMGAADYLVKPVRPAILRAKLHQYQRVLGLQAKNAVLAQQQKAINEHIADPILTIDRDGKLFDLNRAARELLSKHFPNGALGKSIEEIVGIKLGQIRTTSEFEFLQPHREPSTFALSASEWSIGTQSYCTIALHDLTESRQIERMKDEFLATVSHELRTPLTSIQGALGLLAAGAAGTLPTAALELANVAQRNGTRLSRLIDDLLDLTKLEANRMPLKLCLTPLKAILEDALSSNQGYAQSHGVQLRFSTQAEVANSKVDADRLLQVMANLLSNAIKHSPSGGEVEVRLLLDPKGWRIEVSDQGPGIDPEFQKRIFEKFSQADGSDKRRVGGTGLGLYISRVLVERMGGKLLAQSTVGQGSVFSVVLPSPESDRAAKWVLCISRDRQVLDQLTEWMSDLVHTESVTDLAAAKSVVARIGPPSVLLADPQSQGLADEFCKNLLAVVSAHHILLVSDALDEKFAKSHGLTWLALSNTSRGELRTQLEPLLNRAVSGE